MTESDPKWWVAPVEFATHAVVGTLIFSLVALPAIGINLAIKWLDGLGLSAPVLLALQAAEYAVILTDLILLIIFLYRTARRAAKRF